LLTSGLDCISQKTYGDDTEKVSPQNWRKIINNSFSKASVILLGPGLGQSEYAQELVSYVLEHADRPIVLDADGLNAVSALGADILKTTKPPCVVTPHPGEMSRLCGLSVDEIKSDPLKTAKDFATRYNVTVLLKGARTVIAAPDGTAYINISGCAALAKAGSGDVLAGIIAGLIAQQGAGLTEQTVTEAAALGAFLHGRAGERAAESLSQYGVNARDVINALNLTKFS
jgi:NAD(P)H-hydrate epimerase